MSPEEMQRTMEFIVQQQAKFENEIQGLFESDKRLRESEERLRESQGTLTAALLRVTEIVEGLAESQKITDQHLRETDVRLRDTDERLNVLINVVEKQLTRRRNGKKRRKA